MHTANASDTLIPPQQAIDAEIVNNLGLHARAAAKFVKTACRFDAEVTVSLGGESVSGQSIMGLMMLAASRGTVIRLEASGPEADQALDALCALIAERFYEDS